MSNTDKLLEEIIEQRRASEVAIAALREWIAQHSEHAGALASLDLVANQLSTEIVRCDALSGAGREMALANEVIRQNNAQLQANADVHRLEIEQLRDERTAPPVAITEGDDGSERDDPDFPGLASGVVDILDDPRMHGVAWSDARDVTDAMLRSWPLWETRHETCPQDSTRLASYLEVWVDRHGWTWRPLRFPGMGADGVVPASEMTPEHFARCEWEIRIHGQWIAQGAFHVDTNYPQRWRPVGWPDVEAAQERAPILDGEELTADATPNVLDDPRMDGDTWICPTPKERAAWEGPWEMRSGFGGQTATIRQLPGQIPCNFEPIYRPIRSVGTEGAADAEECNCPQAQRLTSELAELRGMASRLSALEQKHDMLAGELWARVCNEPELGHPNTPRAAGLGAVECLACGSLSCMPGACSGGAS